MELGTGIYSSTVLVLLAISVWQITKHKKWKLFGKVCAGLAAVCALVVGVGYLWNYVSNRPKPVTEYEGVKLGASITDVTVALGAPSKVDDNQLSFDEKNLFADFSKDKSRSLIRLCVYGDKVDLMGFNQSSTESDIVKKLGHPNKISVSGDGLSKIINYRKWNANFGIRTNHLELTCMSSEDHQFENEISAADLSKFDLKKLTTAPFGTVSSNADNELANAAAVTPDIRSELPDPCAPNLSKAERKRRLSKFGTIRQTGGGTFEAGGHTITFFEYDGSLISCS